MLMKLEKVVSVKFGSSMMLKWMCCGVGFVRGEVGMLGVIVVNFVMLGRWFYLFYLVCGLWLLGWCGCS